MNSTCQHRKTSTLHFTELSVIVITVEDTFNATPASVKCYYFSSLTEEAMFLYIYVEDLMHTYT